MKGYRILLFRKLCKIISVLGNENIDKIRDRISLYVVMSEDDFLGDKCIFRVKNVEGKNDFIFDVLNFSWFFLFL